MMRNRPHSTDAPNEQEAKTDAPTARIALIHALAHSVAPINAAFEQHWKQAQRVNLLDDSLSADLASNGRGQDAVMHQRFRTLADYAIGSGAQAVLFTCSAFGSCIDAVAQAYPDIPIYRPNEAMIKDLTGPASDIGVDERIGLIATFAPTLQSMPAEFPKSAKLNLMLADGALLALNAGDQDQHDALIAHAAVQLRDHGCSRIALAQFSMARARAACESATGLPVYTTVDSSVEKLRSHFL